MSGDVYTIRSWRFVRRLLVKLVFLPVTALAIFFSVYLRTSPFSPEAALMHLLAARGCAIADALGVAPARDGQPGYHAKFDEDGNGIACEIGTAQAQFRDGPKFIRP